MRKAPQQARSRQMVDRLIDATATCIAERGLTDTPTHAIAETAGVSVGSRYQYFGRRGWPDTWLVRWANWPAPALRAISGN